MSKLQLEMSVIFVNSFRYYVQIVFQAFEADIILPDKYTVHQENRMRFLREIKDLLII